MPTYAQNLQEMEFEELPSSGLIVDSPEAAVLIVETTIIPLSFNSRGGIRRVDEPEAGIYQVQLKPGVHHIEIRAEGYLLLKLPRWNFAPKSGRKIRLRAQPRFGAQDEFAAHRPRLRLEYGAASREEVHVQLDGNPPQKIDFSGGYIILRPTPGAHTVQVFAGGRVWTRSLELETGQSYSETVVMTEGTERAFTTSHSGNLFVESAPPGATVYLNQIEQSGVTPLSLKDLQPGIYQIEVVLAQYLPASRQEEVRELEYRDIHLELTPNYGQVEVSSTPSGAIVYLDGQQRGVTPFSARLDAGVYPLRLVQPLFYDEADTLRIEPGSPFVRSYELRPRFGTVEVTSDPPGASVAVGGVVWGVTPLSRAQVFSGRHIVEVELEGFPRQERAVDVRDAQTHELYVDLSSTVGLLSALSDPPGAAVTIKESGQQLGPTPLRDMPLKPGTYTLVFSLPNHDAVERTVPVAKGDAPQIEVAMVRHVGHVRVESTPPRAQIFLDSVARGKTPQVLRDVPTGTYALRLEKPGYDPAVSQVQVERDEVVDYSVVLDTVSIVEKVVIGAGVEMEFVWIEAGTFTMGSPSSETGRDSDEGPTHEVTISRGFYLGRYEVTQGQWEAVMGTTPWSGKSYVQSNAMAPAVYISWDDVQWFIQRLNAAAGDSLYRLPREAEWEYATRAGTRRRWSFGDDESQLGDYAWYDANAWDVGLKYAQPVGTKLANPWGLYDMHGNVWEWVQDWYDESYYGRSPGVDPLGPTTGSDRVMRGGRFSASAQGVRSAFRDWSVPGRRFSVIGARLLRIR